MKLHFDTNRKGTSARKFIGMLVAVIWTTAALQPCLMASVPDLAGEHAVTVLSPHSVAPERVHRDCPHCPLLGDDQGSSAESAVGACAGDDQAPWLTQTKPADAAKFYRHSDSPMFAQMPAPAAHNDGLAIASHFSLPPRAAGLALFDLFRTYLK